MPVEEYKEISLDGQHFAEDRLRADTCSNGGIGIACRNDDEASIVLLSKEDAVKLAEFILDWTGEFSE